MRQLQKCNNYYLKEFKTIRVVNKVQIIILQLKY